MTFYNKQDHISYIGKTTQKAHKNTSNIGKYTPRQKCTKFREAFK